MKSKKKTKQNTAPELISGDTTTDELTSEAVSELSLSAKESLDLFEESATADHEGESSVDETLELDGEPTEAAFEAIEPIGDEPDLDGDELATEDAGPELETEDLFSQVAQSSQEEPSHEPAAADVEGTELAAYESAEVEDTEFIEAERLQSIIESILFATDRPVSLESFRQVFKGTNIKSPQIKRALQDYAIQLASGNRGVSLEEIGGGYQLRTKIDNLEYLKRQLKIRSFRLSGPALEVLSIVAYKQPCVKLEIDEIRGVESGHLLRALMDRGIVKFAGKSDLPGKPMLYETTRKFLEIFGLRNIRELPSPSEIDDLIPEGIGIPETEERKLGDLTDELSLTAGQTYSEGESELLKISDELKTISTTTEFFEQEMARQRAERDRARAQDIREMILVGQEVDTKDRRWLERYEKQLAEQAAAAAAAVAPMPEQTEPTAEPAEESLTDASTAEEEAVAESQVAETRFEESESLEATTPGADTPADEAESQAETDPNLSENTVTH